MNLRAPLSALILVFILPDSARCQGSRTPPGPPAPSLKTLDQVRARGGVVAFCKAVGNNSKNSGSADINATGATRTG